MSNEWRGMPHIVPNREAYQAAVKSCSMAGIDDEHEILLHATAHVIARLSGAEFAINEELVRLPVGMKELNVITVEAVRKHNRKARAEGMTLL